MPEIKCTVSQCRYWKKDICHADGIEVAGNGVKSDSADSSPETQCVTMKK